MSIQSQEDSRGSGMKLDLTINIPTMLSIFAMVAGAVTYVNGQITAINNQQLVTAGDVKVLQTQVNSQGSQMATLRLDTAGQLTQFRSEVRQDLKDLKDGMDRLNNRGR
ncbi:Rz-like spanin [Salmonella phage BAU.Micro_SLP-22]